MTQLFSKFCVFLKQKNKEAVNISKCETVNCSQPYSQKIARGFDQGRIGGLFDRFIVGMDFTVFVSLKFLAGLEADGLP